MATNSTLVFEGLLRSDGTLELAGRPALPPGPVRVRIEQMHKGNDGPERVPDDPWLDENIPAPFDLPQPLRAHSVDVRRVERLPERHDVPDGDAA
jgi:hypothetical protein